MPFPTDADGNLLVDVALIEERRTHKTLEATFRVGDETEVNGQTALDYARDIFHPVGKFRVVSLPNGGFRTVDTSGGDSSVQVGALSPIRADDSPDFQNGNWYTRSYDEELIDADARVWDVSVVLVARRNLHPFSEFADDDDGDTLFTLSQATGNGLFDISINENKTGLSPTDSGTPDPYHILFSFPVTRQIYTVNVDTDSSRGERETFPMLTLSTVLRPKNVQLMEHMLGMLDAVSVRPVPDGENVLSGGTAFLKNPYASGDYLSVNTATFVAVPDGAEDTIAVGQEYVIRDFETTYTGGPNGVYTMELKMVRKVPLDSL